MHLSRSLASAGFVVTVLVMVTALVACSSTTVSDDSSATAFPTSVMMSPSQTAVALPVPETLTDASVTLRDGPVAVPLALLLPSVDVDASVLGVGMTSADVMDAPMGTADDPVWQQAFWYRGSAVPGATSTALIAGHVSDSRGRPGVFGRLDRLVVGDPIVVHDTRTGLDVRFQVTGSTTFSLDETTDPAVLTQIYGAGPVAGLPPEPSTDGLAHLTLITCAGTFRNGTHDHRLVVFADRVG